MMEEWIRELMNHVFEMQVHKNCGRNFGRKCVGLNVLL